MSIFWSSTTTPAVASFDDANFFSFTTEGQPISRAELSKTILKKVLPEAMFRRYVSKITDFGQGKSDHILMTKKLTHDYSEVWSTVAEFDPLPLGTMNYCRYDIAVEERGKQFPFTERVKLFSNYDIEAEIREQAGNSIIASIERDLLMNAFIYLDVLGICDANDAITVSTGKSLAPTRSFGVNSTTITVQQATVDPATGSIEGTVPAPLTMKHVLNFAQALSALNTPSYTGNGFGDYLVIVNAQARNRLLTDETFFTATTRFQDKERIYEGYIGTFYGQEFVEDKGKWIDRLVYNLNPAYRGKAICIFLGKDAIKEAIVKPEQILPLQKADFGRFMSYAIQTYRGEAPIWFSSEGQASGGVLIGA